MKHKQIYYSSFLIAIISLICIISCQKEDRYSHYSQNKSYDGTIYDLLESHPETFGLVLFAFQKAGLTPLLKKDDSLTLFAPTDINLKSALEKYNVNRRSRNLSSAGLNNIDSSSLRAILSPYIFTHMYSMSDFERQDGLTITSLALRPMNGEVIRYNASGVEGAGSETIKFSYLNGSRFTENWIPAYVATPNIKTKNGIVHILGNRHLLGFDFFIEKAKELQNVYSEKVTFAKGQIISPDGSIDLWDSHVKELRAVNSNTVEAEAANLLNRGYKMWLTVHDNDSVTIISAPGTVNLTIENDGPCYFDIENYQFILNYSFIDSKGKHTISETISYLNNKLK